MQGAGGNCNVVKEIIYPLGAEIDVRAIKLGDKTMSVLEIWGAGTCRAPSLPARSIACQTAAHGGRSAFVGGRASVDDVESDMVPILPIQHASPMLGVLWSVQSTRRTTAC